MTTDTPPQADREAAMALSIRSALDLSDELLDDLDLNAVAKAALASQPEAGEPETGWLIERKDIATVESHNKVCLHYYAEYPNGDHYWTPDHLKAMRFATEADARVIAKDDPLLTVAEHMWLHLPEPTPQAREDVGESVEPVKATREWAVRLANMRQGKRSPPRYEAPGEYMVYMAGECIEEVLAALPPLYTHPTPTELPGDALRATFKLAASQIERDVRLSELTDEEIDALVRAVREV